MSVVCLCNALTEAQVRLAVAAGAMRPREVHAACACRAQCGQCVRALLAMVREALPTEEFRTTTGKTGVGSGFVNQSDRRLRFTWQKPRPTLQGRAS